MWTVPAEKPPAAVLATGTNYEFIPAYWYLRAANEDSSK